MAMSKSFLPSDSNWLHELAKNEINPDAASPFNALSELDPQQLIEESAVEVLEHLRSLFNDYIRVFNGYSETGSKFNDVKIYAISGTAADFMIFRNNVKLVFANTAHGLINISFHQHIRSDLVDGSQVVRNTVATNEQLKWMTQPKDLIAQMGPFLDIQWTFQGEKVNFNQLARFYFIEFIKQSRTQKKESQNQLLLKQIKSLLQDKGINF